LITSFLPAARTVSTPLLLAVLFCTSAKAADSSLTAMENSLSELIFRASRSVVTVEASRPFTSEDLSGNGGESLQQLISSGLVMDSSGHVLTAASCVIGFDHISISIDNREMPARVVGVDYQSGLALLRTGEPAGEPVVLSRQHGCAGRMVVALGNSMGVRACPSIGFCAGFRPDGMLQFTTTITPGSLGGGMFDLSGRLVGAVVDGLGDGQVADAAVAVPAHKLPTIVRYLSTRGDREAGYIGIATADIEITPGLEITIPARLASASAGAGQRVLRQATLITEVMPSSAAERAGLRRGDLLFSVNGSIIHSAWDLMHLVQRQKPGSVLEMGLIRNDRPQLVRIKIGRRTINPGAAFSTPADTSFNGQSTSHRSILQQIESLRRELERLERQVHQR
jgi:serine protease Do